MEASRPVDSWSSLHILRQSYNPTAIEIAAFLGKLNLLNLILSQGIEEKLDTPLMLACLNNQLEAVKILVEAGANVDHADQFGRTPIHAASWRGNVMILRFLLQRGASLNAVVKVSNAHNGIVAGDTVLHSACKGIACADEVVRRLLALGEDPNARNEMGETPLHCAVKQVVLPRKVDLLLKGGATVNATDTRGRYPIHYASAESMIKLVEFGADIDALDAAGQHVLHMCWNADTTYAVLALGGGSHVKCHADNCGCAGSSVLMCSYHATCRNVEEMVETEKNGREWQGPSSEVRLYAFGRYFILTAVAGISLGEQNEEIHYPALPRHHHHFLNYFEKECSTEFANMDATIPGTRVTYKGVLLQQPSALRDPMLKTLITRKHCQRRYNRYGELIHSRYIIGQRKRRLVHQCSRFFTCILGLYNFPEGCIENILWHLHENDLRNLMTVCRTFDASPSKDMSEASDLSGGRMRVYAQTWFIPFLLFVIFVAIIFQLFN